MQDRSKDDRSPADQRGFGASGEGVERPIRLCPAAPVRGRTAHAMVEAGTARWLAGGPAAFTHLDILEPNAPPVLIALGDLEVWLAQRPSWRRLALATLATISAPRPPWGGLALDRPRLMGVVNVTPDSFSDGGRFFDATRAIEHGRALIAAGADMIDIGGESTRPGAAALDAEEELRRVIPVVRALAATGAAVSIDTRRARVMLAALAAGARAVNDVTALAGDPDSLAVVARSDAAVVLMHMQGEPATMQCDPRYADVLGEVGDFLRARIAACERAGIARKRILVDPGIGFGKTLAHNLELVAHLAAFHALGTGLMLGASRKSFIARASRGEDTEHRLAGSLAAALGAVEQGAQWLRVHEVAETRQALALRQQIDSAT